MIGAKVLLYGLQLGPIGQHGLLEAGLGIGIPPAQAETAEEHFPADAVAQRHQILPEVFVVGGRRLDGGQQGFALHPLFLGGNQGVVEVDRPLHGRMHRPAVGAEAQVGEMAAGFQQFLLLAAEFLGLLLALLGQNPADIAGRPLVHAIHEVEVRLHHRLHHVDRHLRVLRAIAHLQDARQSNRLCRELPLQRGDATFPRSARQIDAIAGPQVHQGPFDHLGAAYHVLESRHGVLTHRFLVGDRRVEVVGSALRDQQSRLRRVESRRGNVVQPAQ